MGGQIKPDLVAPLHGVGARPCDTPYNDHLFAYPACAGRIGGTSAAAPVAVGAIASLLSGLKQEGRSASIQGLLHALRFSAQPIEGYQSHEQGYGLLQIPAAWHALSAPAVDGGVHIEVGRREVSIFGVVPPEVGRGVFDVYNLQRDQAYTRQVLVTRTVGAGGAKRHELRFRGSASGAFSIPHAVDLALDERVPIDVEIHPSQPGIFSEIVDVIDPVTDTIVGAFQLSVIAAYELEPQTPLLITTRTRFPDGGSEFILVPSGLGSVSISYRPEDAPIRLMAHLPTPADLGPEGFLGEPWRETQRLRRGGDLVLPGQSETISTLNPVPGVWELRTLMCTFVSPQAHECDIFRHVEEYQRDTEVVITITAED